MLLLPLDHFALRWERAYGRHDWGKMFRQVATRAHPSFVLFGELWSKRRACFGMDSARVIPLPRACGLLDGQIEIEESASDIME